MRRMLFGLGLGLAACSNPAPNAIPAEAGPVQGSSATRGKVDESVPRLPADAATPVPGVPDTRPVKRVALAFPTAFQGNWGQTLADCDASRPDAPGLMKVRGATLDFHDSTATARTLTARDPYRIVADLDYKGGERNWQHRETLSLELGGIRLSRSGAGGTYRYEKC